MFFEKSHKTFTHLVVVITTAAIMFYSEQALAVHENADEAASYSMFMLQG
jgi:hypothetical protein